MTLRAKKPTMKEVRFKTLIYGDKGTGKTHFCCSFPEPYYIDTEGLEDYPHFKEMIIENNGDLISLPHLEEIIEEVKSLISLKHHYKTLIIDSISFPYGWLTQTEIERLTKKSPNTEGTEFGANVAKAKRLTYKLGILLSQLDMNIVVIAHEKIRYVDGKEVGKTFDINDKLAYTLGAVLRLQLQGKSRKLFVEKSRYKELETSSTINFDEGYKIIENLFGKDIFHRESKNIEIATDSQVEELNKLISEHNIPEKIIQSWLTKAEAKAFEFMEKEKIQKCIDYVKSKVISEAA